MHQTAEYDSHPRASAEPLVEASVIGFDSDQAIERLSSAAAGACRLQAVGTHRRLV